MAHAVDSLYRECGLCPSIPKAGTLAERLLGAGALRWASCPQIPAARLVHAERRHFVDLRRDAPRPEILAGICREIARWYLFQYPGPPGRISVDTFGECIALPRQAVWLSAELGLTAVEAAAMYDLPVALVERRFCKVLDADESGEFPSLGAIRSAI